MIRLTQAILNCAIFSNNYVREHFLYIFNFILVSVFSIIIIEKYMFVSCVFFWGGGGGEGLLPLFVRVLFGGFFVQLCVCVGYGIRVYACAVCVCVVSVLFFIVVSLVFFSVYVVFVIIVKKDK